MNKKFMILAFVIISLGFCFQARAEVLLKVIKPDFSKRSEKYNAYGQRIKIISKNDGLILIEYDYSGSYYQGITVYFYFENTGSSGEHEFIATLLEKKVDSSEQPPNPSGLSRKTTFKLEERKKYALRIPIVFGNSMSTQHDASARRLAAREFTIQWIEKKSVMDELILRMSAWDAKIEELQLLDFNKAQGNDSK